jgi:hypothetical protein
MNFDLGHLVRIDGDKANSYCVRAVRGGQKKWI